MGKKFSSQTEINTDIYTRLEKLESLISDKKKQQKMKLWYRPGSTIEKIVLLIQKGFFNEPKSLNEIIYKLKKQDFHLKASDLTLPLRKIVRKELLEKTDKLSDGGISKTWLYKKA